MNKRKLVTDRRPGWQGPYGAVDMNNVVDKTTEYLSTGGLFNPDLMDHNKVRDMVIECREEICRLEKKLTETVTLMSTETERLAARMNHYQHALQEIWDIADQCGESVSKRLASDALTKKV